jgi:hypothetical protein
MLAPIHWLSLTTSVLLLAACPSARAPQPASRVDDARTARVCEDTPGSTPGVNCVPAALAQRQLPCRAQGEDIDGKDFGVKCCASLHAEPVLEHVDGHCVTRAPPSVRVCVQCGDGVCGSGENFCNCPADCPAR